MKQFILITCILFINLLQLNGQQVNAQHILQGKYSVSLQNNKTDQGYSISLYNNLPGIYRIQTTFEITDTLGNKKTIHVQHQQSGAEFILCHSIEPIRGLAFNTITIDYLQYGEAYRLTWVEQNGVLNFSKQGNEYTYANPFTLNATTFKWTVMEQPVTPSELNLNPTELIANY